MKKSALILLLTVLCCMPVFAQKKSKKADATTSQPVMITFVAANNEEFILHFDGQRINKEPQCRVEVKADKAKLNTDYNVRVVIKKPRVGSDMAFGTMQIKQQGEEYLIWANSKFDKAEILTRDEYRAKNARKVAPNAPTPRILDRREVKKAMINSEELPDNVIIIEKKETTTNQ